MHVNVNNINWYMFLSNHKEQNNSKTTMPPWLYMVVHHKSNASRGEDHPSVLNDNHPSDCRDSGSRCVGRRGSERLRVFVHGDEQRREGGRELGAVHRWGYCHGRVVSSLCSSAWTTIMRHELTQNDYCTKLTKRYFGRPLRDKSSAYQLALWVSFRYNCFCMSA